MAATRNSSMGRPTKCPSPRASAASSFNLPPSSSLGNASLGPEQALGQSFTLLLSVRLLLGEQLQLLPCVFAFLLKCGVLQRSLLPLDRQVKLPNLGIGNCQRIQVVGLAPVGHLAGQLGV